MKNSFKEFYSLSKEDFKVLWEEGTFVLDANVLLNLYRYSQQTSQKLLEILKDNKINSRLWIPHQFALEYQKERLNVICEQKLSYEQLLKAIEDLIKDYSRHPFLKMQAIMQSAKKAVKKKQKKHPEWDRNDPIRDDITKLFEGKVGSPFAVEKIEAIYKDGEKRYSSLIPPGYKDAKKSLDERFGDLLGWLQTLEYAEKNKKNVMFITDDDKEDWWWIIKGETIGARYQLIKEIKEKTGLLFHMYDSRGFIKYAGEYLQQDVDKAIVAEIEEVSKKRHDEQVGSSSASSASLDASGDIADSSTSADIQTICNEDTGKTEAPQG